MGASGLSSQTKQSGSVSPASVGDLAVSGET